MLPGDRAQPAAERGLLVGRRTRCEALRGAVLADAPAGPSFGDPEAVPKSDDCSTAALRG
jgi:hypothetical protein